MKRQKPNVLRKIITFIEEIEKRTQVKKWKDIISKHFQKELRNIETDIQTLSKILKIQK